MVLRIEAKEDLFRVVKQTTQLTNELRIGERDTPGMVSSKTVVDYAKIGRSRLDLSRIDGGRLMDGVSKQSWSKVRAALLHEAERLCFQHRRECDVFQRAWRAAKTIEERDEAFALAASAAAKANIAAHAFQYVTEEERPDERSQPKRTKRRSLPSPNGRDWREDAFEEISEVKRPAFAALWAGARPTEIEKGVTVRMVIHNDQRCVQITIHGAKTGPSSGQEERTLIFSEKSPLGQALLESVEYPGHVVTIQRGAARLNKDFAAMRKSGLIKKGISPYSLRHQFCADLKADGRDPEAIAEAMGHASARSQNNYGSVKQGRGGVALEGVEATRSVRTEWNKGPRQAAPVHDPFS